MNTLSTLSFPTYSFRLRNQGDGSEIFDELRKKWLVLTPEEWVRQHLVRYLAEEKGYPSALISLEKLVSVNGLPQRTDMVVHDRTGSAIVVVECKAPAIRIDQSVFDQAARYNASIKAPYLLVTNGLTHYFCKIDWQTNGSQFLPDILHFNELLIK
ncbi:MAG: type I restriction enzyme HsdR N-terminal domain-containing protein [Flavobacteriales bacterium]|nr:type I restriction enzyme HsdR N-terminal domain-containing protein [Flavobacteriales bacterium]